MSRAQIHSPPTSPASLSESVHCLVGHKTQLEYRVWGLRLDNLEFVCMRACVCVSACTLWLLWSNAQSPDAPTQQVSTTLLSRQQRNTFMALSGKKKCVFKFSLKRHVTHGLISVLRSHLFPIKGHSFAATTEEMHLRSDNSLPAQDEQL